MLAFDGRTSEQITPFNTTEKEIKMYDQLLANLRSYFSLNLTIAMKYELKQTLIIIELNGLEQNIL